VETTVNATRFEALDVFVALLSEIDSPDSSGDFYGRLCEAICRLTRMQRVVLFLYDDGLNRVRAVGSHGVERELIDQLHGTLEEAPLAQRALAEDRVVEVSDNLDRELPKRYAHSLGLTTVTCAPLSAAGRWLGVLFADRGTERFTSSETERHTMWMLGKLAALAASARIATRQQEHARRLSDRIGLAREVHERVMQRLFGVSLALSSEQELEPQQRLRCRDEIRSALGDLRTALRRPLAPRAPETTSTLAEELERLGGQNPNGVSLQVDWPDDTCVPPELESLAQSVFSEAMRNADKHAAPSYIEVNLSSQDNVFSLEVVNDGAYDDSSGTGMGLRIAAFEAVQQGGVVEFGRMDGQRWRVRLAVPLTAN
jgi:signal transduction histidine kinase